ncbi:hypothetical protein [Vagococcus xieshaowenii]|uniref:Uncharacterized protein n=1 Tax=Vagococcus xieshaowenii TaxID=2562451 RepID=A0AAJ5EFM2_9ENTE|nr:hypothetical protein [Vagococcus xieshaowenii]QCA29687.1 hypothetical protein E4Z98_09885 [Vagococcus xieshaowenii]TFZ42962.1 hypothetical protein E4031_01625 [Vagococcus xieshaowenii]
MQIKKSKIDQLRDWWEVASIRLRRSQSKIYIVWFLGIVVFYSVMIGARFVTNNDPVFLSSKAGEQVVIANNTYELVESKIDDNNRSLTLSLGNTDLGISVEDYEVSASFEYRNSSEIQTKIETFTGDNNYMTIYATDLPKQWDVIKVHVSIKSETSEGDEVFYISKQDKKSEVITPPTENSVGAASVKYAIGLRQQLLDDLDKQEETIHQNTENNHETIARLTEQLSFQTETQQTDTQAQISNLENQNTQNDNQLVQLDKDRIEYLNQIEKLKERQKVFENH